jgi:hypothetical protein
MASFFVAHDPSNASVALTQICPHDKVRRYSLLKGDTGRAPVT